jgi:hypothetical protein
MGCWRNDGGLGEVVSLPLAVGHRVEQFVVTPTSRCLASSGMLKLSMETSAATSKAPLSISSTEIDPRSRGRSRCVIPHPSASNVTGIAVGERNG